MSLHIGLLIYGSLAARSGGYLYDRKLVEYLRQQGDTVEVISLPWRNYPRHLADNLSPALFRRLANLKVDVLLQDELNHPSLFWANPLTRSSRQYPIVSIVHHLRSSELRPAWQNRLYRQVERRYLAGVDAFIFNSQTTRQAVERLAGPPKPAAVVYPAASHMSFRITPEEVRARAYQPGCLKILFVGNLIPRKGLHVLIQALAALPEKNWELRVVGNEQVDPAYSQLVRHCPAQSGLDGKVRFLGALPQANLEEVYRNSHVLAVPSSYEGFGIVYLEGMGYGLPAVATTAGAAGELVVPGFNGCLVAPEDPPAIANVLAGWLEDRDTLNRQAQNALETYARHPTWEQTGANIRNFLEQLTQSKGTFQY